MDLGNDVSRVLDSKHLGWKLIAFKNGAPPSDAEMNLMGQINTDATRELVHSQTPSGWFGDPLYADKDYHFNASYQNYFYLGRQLEVNLTPTNGVKNILWANVNGWVVPVTGTNVNNAEDLSDTDFRNKIILDFPPTTGYEVNFVFLEVWQQLIEGGSATGKPSTEAIYKYGNVLFGGTNPDDDIILPEMGAETTRRVQLQYRIRMVPSVDIVTYPTGFGDTSHVKGQAGQVDPTALVYAPVAGDPGLWVAGDGDPDNDLGTVDGYVYAIPICVVPRMNRGGWSVSDQNGGLVRVSPPGDYTAGDPDDGCFLTSGELSAAPDSDRPDGKYADYIYSVIDMRHIVSQSSDYSAILKRNFQAICDGSSTLTGKLSTVGGSQFGTKILYTDEINGTGTDNPSTILIGEADGVRRIFSDVPTHQSRNISELEISEKDVSSPTYGTDPDKWLPTDVIKIPHPSSLSGADYPSHFLTAVADVRVTLKGFRSEVTQGFVTSATADTLTSTGAFTTWFPSPTQWTGYAVTIVDGLGSGQTRTIESIDNNNRITVYTNWTTTPDATSSFSISPPIFDVTATEDATEMTVTIIAINNDVNTTVFETLAFDGNLVVEYVMHYPAQQGLSLRPDSLYQVNYTNPTVSVLRAPEVDSGINPFMIRDIQLSPDFQIEPTYQGSTVIEADCYADVGSKTVLIQPWQRASIHLYAMQVDTYEPGHSYYGLFSQGMVFEVPDTYLPKIGYNAIPIIESAYGSFFTGLHVWGYNETDAAVESVINILGRADFDDDTTAGSNVWVRNDSITYEDESASKIGCRINPDIGGIEFPTYIGVSRIIAVFEDADYTSNGMSATNLLAFHTRNDLVGQTIHIGKTSDHKDVTFTLLPESITDYDEATEYVIIANVFGYRPGFMLTNGLITTHEQISTIGDSVTLYAVVTQALPSSAIIQISYDRTPYQGHIYSEQEPYATNSPEPFNNRGLVSPDDLAHLEMPIESFTFGTALHYDVLAMEEYVMTSGTGRFSGHPVIESYGRGMTSYPTGSPNPSILRSSKIDSTTAGAITRLPLGAKYRDADFVGDDIGVGSVKGTLVSIGTNLSLTSGNTVTITDGMVTYSDNSRYRVTRGGSIGLQEDGISPVSVSSKQIETGWMSLYVIAMLVKTYNEQAPETYDEAYHVSTNPYVLKGREGELQMILISKVIPPVFEADDYHLQDLSVDVCPNGLGEGYVAVDRYRCIGRPLEYQRNQNTYTTSVDDVTSLDNPVTYRPDIRSIDPYIVSNKTELTLTGVDLDISVVGTEISYRPMYSTGEWASLNRYVISSTPTEVVLGLPTGSMGVHDIMVTHSGYSKVLRKAIVIQENDIQPWIDSNENLEQYYPKQNPTGWVSNVGRLIRLDGSEAYLGTQSIRFEGVGTSGDNITRKEFGTDRIYGSGGLLEVAFSFKVGATLNTGNEIQFAIVDDTESDVLTLTLIPASVAYEVILPTYMTGTSDETSTRSISPDTEWHQVRLIVSDIGIAQVYFDTTQIGVDVDCSAGTPVSSNTVPLRFEVRNSTFGMGIVTSAIVNIDNLFVKVSL